MMYLILAVQCHSNKISLGPEQNKYAEKMVHTTVYRSWKDYTYHFKSMNSTNYRLGNRLVYFLSWLPLGWLVADRYSSAVVMITLTTLFIVWNCEIVLDLIKTYSCSMHHLECQSTHLWQAIIYYSDQTLSIVKKPWIPVVTWFRDCRSTCGFTRAHWVKMEF